MAPMDKRPDLPLVRLNLILPVVLELDRRRVNANAVLAANGLVRDTLLDKSVFVPPIVIHRFLEDAASTAGDPHLCVRVGEALDVTRWAPLVDAATRATTLGEFLTRFVRAAKTEASSARHVLEIGPEFAVFSEKRTSDQEIAPAQNDAFTAGFILTLLRRGAGASWDPAEVLLRVCDPAALPPKYMGVQVIAGDRMGMTVRLPAGWLVQAFDQRGFLESSVAGEERPVPTGFVDALRHALRPHLKSRELGVDFAARLLGMSRQSLQRKLRANGTTLSAEIRALKRKRAIVDLVDSNRSIAAVAASLGFHDPTSFTRAFKRWVGASPREYRTSRRTR